MGRRSASPRGRPAARHQAGSAAECAAGQAVVRTGRAAARRSVPARPAPSVASPRLPARRRAAGPPDDRSPGPTRTRGRRRRPGSRPAPRRSPRACRRPPVRARGTPLLVDAHASTVRQLPGSRHRERCAFAVNVPAASPDTWQGQSCERPGPRPRARGADGPVRPPRPRRGPRHLHDDPRRRDHRRPVVGVAGAAGGRRAHAHRRRRALARADRGGTRGTAGDHCSGRGGTGGPRCSPRPCRRRSCWRSGSSSSSRACAGCSCRRPSHHRSWWCSASSGSRATPCRSSCCCARADGR